jgi:hypothetical protein
MNRARGCIHATHIHVQFTLSPHLQLPLLYSIPISSIRHFLSTGPERLSTGKLGLSLRFNLPIRSLDREMEFGLVASVGPLLFVIFAYFFKSD